MSPATHTGIATVLLCAATVAYTHSMPEFGRFFAGHNDFLPLYTLGRTAGTAQIYDVEAGYQEQDRTVGFHIAGRYHNRFPWQALLIAPLSRLPYPAAYWLWIGINLACFAVVIRHWLLPRDYVLWGAVFFPAAASLIVGQDALMAAACLAGVLILANRGQDVAAGLLLALCTAKPHLFLLVPVAIVAQRRWRLLGSAIAGTLGLLAVSTAVAGLDWVSRLAAIVELLGGDSGLDVPLRPSVFQFGVNNVTIVAAAFLAIALCLAIWRVRTLEAGVAAAVLGSILIAPHTSVYDLPLLLIALPALSLTHHSQWLRITLLTPLPYWALLRGSPWNALLPMLLLAAVMASALRRQQPGDRGVQTQTAQSVPCTAGTADVAVQSETDNLKRQRDESLEHGGKRTSRR